MNIVSQTVNHEQGMVLPSNLTEIKYPRVGVLAGWKLKNGGLKSRIHSQNPERGSNNAFPALISWYCSVCPPHKPQHVEEPLPIALCGSETGRACWTRHLEQHFKA